MTLYTLCCIHYTENIANDEICIRGITIKFDHQIDIYFEWKYNTGFVCQKVFLETWEFGTVGHDLFWESLRKTFPSMLNYYFQNLLR